MSVADALLERRIIHKSRTCVVVREVWDLDHPGCPFVQQGRMREPPTPERLGVELRLPRVPGRKRSGAYRGMAALCPLCQTPLYGLDVETHAACRTRERLARYTAMLKQSPREATKRKARRRKYYDSQESQG